MKRLDFYALKRPVQDRLLDALRGKDDAVPIAQHRGAPRLGYLWLLLAPIAAAGMFVLRQRGFGDLNSVVALQPTAWIGAYVALGFVAVASLLQTLAHAQRVGSLPFGPGVYLFGAMALDARRHVLVVHPMEDVAAVEGPDASGTLRLAFKDGARFSFPFEDAGAAARAFDAIEKARARASEPQREGLLASDPLHEARISNPLARQDPLVRRVPLWSRLRLPIALAIAAGAGFALHRARNAASDERIFALAEAQDDVAGWKAYLAHGLAHRDEVSATRLPRAELRLAVQQQSVQAIEAFLAAHPASAIDDEVQKALHDAMLTELGTARSAGTLAALQAFAQKHPAHHLDAELRDATHAVFAEGQTKLLALLGSDATLAPFFTALVSYAEHRDLAAPPPKVQVRVRWKGARFKWADKFVAKTPAFQGDRSFPTRYFDAAHLQPDEEAFASALSARLLAAFPPELLGIERGAAIPPADPDDKDAPLPAATVPTVFIEHVEEWVGASVIIPKPRGIFLGVTFVFDVTFVLPGGGKPLHFKLGISRAPNLKVLAEESTKPGAKAPESIVYDTEQTEAFAEVQRRLFAWLFKGN